jgi:ERO1-like protein alpha
VHVCLAFAVVLQLANPAISESCPMPFDEGRLWKGEGAVELKRQLQLTFQNITRVMDCVGCEKCKLWGKLQTLGGCGL